MRKQTNFMAVLSAATLMLAAAPMMTNYTGIHTAMAADKGWVEEDGSWAYYDEDGYKEANTWKKKDNNWLFLDEDGEVTRSQRVDDYYVNADGLMVKNQWVSADDEEEYDSPDSPAGESWLYFGKDGKAVTSKWMEINDKTYYFDDEGLMVTGLTEIDGDTYYLGNEGDGARKTGWVMLEDITNESGDEDIWCYFDNDGKMIMDQMDRKINGQYYTFVDGQMQTGWVNLADFGFITKSEAATESEADKVSLDDFRYYDEEKGGARASGWYTIEGAPGISESDNDYTFYFKGGKAYHAEKDIEIFNIESKRYAFNENGEMQTGIQTLYDTDGTPLVYYFDENGVMQTGKQTIYDEDLEENQTWYFNLKGNHKGEGFHGERDKQIYVHGLLKKADPELRYEPVAIGEKNYLVNTSGTIQKASSASTSASKPELGKGFKDIKDADDTVWTVDTSGIIQ